MEPNDLDELMRKYLAGETSLKEERSLREGFAQGGIPTEWAHMAPYFRFIRSERQESAPETKPPKGRVWHWGLLLALAGLLGLAAYHWGLRQSTEEPPLRAQRIEPKDPEKALAIAKEALWLVSSKMEEGTNAARREMETFRRINQAARRK